MMNSKLATTFLRRSSPVLLRCTTRQCGGGVHVRAFSSLLNNHNKPGVVPPPSSLIPPPPPPFAVDSPDGTNHELDAQREQQVVDDFVKVESEHKFCQHLLEEDVDFVAASTGPPTALHPIDATADQQTTKPPVDAHHLLGITPQDIDRVEYDKYVESVAYMEDLHFAPRSTRPGDQEDAENNNNNNNNNPLRFDAVEGPDGTPDDVVLHDLEEVDHLIQEAAVAEDRELIEKMHAAHFNAVESPDGTPDDIALHDLEEVDHLIQEAAVTEDRAVIEQRHAAADEAERVMAVDGPDGQCDDAALTDSRVVQDMIDHAALHEDADEIRRVHQENQAIQSTLSKITPKDPFDI